jgi:hypothetical protein
MHMKTTVTTRQLSKFLELLEQKGVTPEIFQQRLSNGVLADIFDSAAVFQDRDQWRNAFGLGPVIPEPIILTIDYTKSLEQMIAAGNYDWKNDDLTASRFPIVGEGMAEYEFRYVHPNRSISSEGAINLIKKEDSENPWIPAQTEHLLSFGAAYPEEQRKYPIVALGSVGEVGGRRVPSLDEGVARRHLSLHWWVLDWDSRFRFLVVRKVTRGSVS